MVSTIGYSMIPLVMIGFVTSLMHAILNGIIKFIFLTLGLSWSTVACMLVMRDFGNESKKWLYIYPIFLFYSFLGWYATVA